ncbi:hypothetical protein ACTA71_000134 [Dictyostelium dimigraforme]
MSFKISKISELEELISVSKSKRLNNAIKKKKISPYEKNKKLTKFSQCFHYSIEKLKSRIKKNIERKVELQKVKDELLGQSTTAIFKKQIGQKEDRIQLNKELEAKISVLGKEILQQEQEKLKESIEKEREPVKVDRLSLINQADSMNEELVKLKQQMELEKRRNQYKKLHIKTEGENVTCRNTVEIITQKLSYGCIINNERWFGEHSIRRTHWKITIKDKFARTILLSLSNCDKELNKGVTIQDPRYGIFKLRARSIILFNSNLIYTTPKGLFQISHKDNGSGGIRSIDNEGEDQDI